MGTNTTQAANVAMLKNLPYDPAKDFAPIIRTTTTAMVLLVKPDFPAQNLAQFMDYARAHPNMTAGYGSGASQISIGQLQSRGGLSLIATSYRGVPQAVTDVLAGVIDLAFADFSLAIPQMQGGTLRGIGVTSPKRNELTPGLPALAEAMPGFEATIWYGLLAPANAPEPVVNKLYASCAKFLSMPATREKLASVGVIVSPMAPAEFGAFIAAEIIRWTADAKAAGIEAK
jgi:tripartite-type tricarboxylate transporter receptor subunit TctC